MKRFLIALSLSITLSLSSFAASTGGIGGEPLNPLDPENKGWFIYNLDRGDTYQDTLLLKNTSNKRWRIILYPSDYIRPSGGGFDVKQRGETMSKVGKWVTLSESEVILEPNTSKQIPFTISIPLDSEPGETAGAIMMQQFDPETDQTPTVERRGGITLSFRTGVRIYNTTSDPVYEELIHKGAILDKKILPSGEKYIQITQKVQNSGNISTRAYYEYTVENALSGKKYYENIDSDRYFLVSPDTEFPSIQHIGKGEDDALPRGGLLNVYMKVFHGQKDGTKKIIYEESKQVFIFPIYEVLTIVGTLFILFILFILYRKVTWMKYEVEKGDTIESIALDFDTRVSKLRSRNKLPTSYKLKKGEEILVPKF